MPNTREIPIARELDAIRRSLRALEEALPRLTDWLQEYAPRPSTGSDHSPRRKLKLSPVRVRAIRLHGRYLGYLRQLKPRAKAQVKPLRAKKGVRMAIARARKLAGK